MFSKILIANRGEIACRIIHSAHKMGIRCVAVYSSADSQARHVAMADEAFLLGGAASNESYLKGDKIIDIALKSGAQAIHPGYGFLSENADFAKACEQHNLVFIGPPASAITAMGSKSAAKSIMQQAGVPLVPGYHGAEQSPALLKQEAEKCGFPLLLKAVAGGGGKGMRVVNELSEFDAALVSAQREAEKSFANPDMLLERYLTKPRHVEIQVFCDRFGNGVYLAERDCSIQRRHQKVLEEAPAPNLAEKTRQAMGEAALAAALAIEYQGAGTVEFLYDEDGSFYFMEMNTRLQVEHPVTEMISGQDLVEWQLRVAYGEALPLKQEDIQIRGHALEVRVYAEDPDNDFLPVTGTLHYLRTPAESAKVRVDTGVIEGDEVSIYYDPMIAKLIVWDENREQAINRMVQALEAFRIGGMKNNLHFLHRLANSQPFRAAQLDTGFIDKHQTLLMPQAHTDLSQQLALATCFVLLQERQQNAMQYDPYSPFNQQSSWRLNMQYARPMQWVVGDATYLVSICEQENGYLLRLADTELQVFPSLQADYLQAVINGHHLRVHGYLNDDELTLFQQGSAFQCRLFRPVFNVQTQADEASLNAPMNGTVVAVLVAPGDKVAQGDTLMIMEAMKMEHSIKAPYAGEVSEVYWQVKDLVDEGATLVAVTADEKES